MFNFNTIISLGLTFYCSDSKQRDFGILLIIFVFMEMLYFFVPDTSICLSESSVFPRNFMRNGLSTHARTSSIHTIRRSTENWLWNSHQTSKLWLTSYLLPVFLDAITSQDYDYNCFHPINIWRHLRHLNSQCLFCRKLAVNKCRK